MECRGDADLISRKTVVAGMLALVIGGGLWWWAVEHWDDCDRFLHGDLSQSASMDVKSGTHTIAMPCNVWVARQPVGVQGVYLAEMAVLLAFVVSAVGDWGRGRGRGRGMQ